MPILKFSRTGQDVVLEKLRMEDITEDNRTALLDRSAFMCPKYRIDTDVNIEHIKKDHRRNAYPRR
jgi:hypothetical protein